MAKIVYITGSRAEYGVMRQLLKKLNKHPLFELSLIVTGMHLCKKFGFTVRDIRKDKFKIGATVAVNLKDNTLAGMAKSVGQAIIGITQALEKIHPRLVLLTGDRGEMLAGAIAASHLNIPVVHISGGDRTTGATIDERLRHAITKLADIHFPANEKSAKNIIEMGENPECVFPVGNPGTPITYYLSNKRKKEIVRKYHLNPNQPILLVLQHPVTTQAKSAASQMKATMEAIKELKMQAIVVYPNSDAGSKDMIGVIHQYEYLDFVQIYKNIGRDDFQDIMALSDVIIGNSSCALLEAPSFNLPAVNVGVRQERRECACNVIDVNHNKAEIIKAVKKALSREFKKRVMGVQSPYAKENPEEKIIKILKKIKPSEFLKKKFQMTESH